MFFVVFTSLLVLLHVHVGFRLFVDTKLPPLQRNLGLLGVAALCLLVPASMALNTRAPRLLSFAAYAWLGSLFYLWVFLLLRDLAVYPFRIASFLVRLVKRLRSAADSGVRALPPDTPPSPERRVFLSRVVSSGAAIATVGIGGYGMRSALGEITTPELVVRLSRLPKALDGFHVAQLSDVHIGALLGRGFLRGVVEQTNRLKPDLVVITGDLVDGKVQEIGQTVALLRELRAPHGVCFVTGNHEYYSGGESWIRFLRSLGMTVLQNERVSIGDRDGKASFDVLGVPDASAHHMHAVGEDMQLAARGRDPERELVVLAHQPLQFPGARRIGAGLQLSGHTHGGQVQPFGQLVALVQPYVAGLHREGDNQIYVSRGTGFWGPPMRVAAPAEITSIRLVSG